MAPMYDAICTAAYPRLAKKMAMSLGGTSYAIGPEANKLVEEMSENSTYHPILKTVQKIIYTRCALVLRTLDEPNL